VGSTVDADLASLESLQRGYMRIRDPKMALILRIEDSVRFAIREYLNAKGFYELDDPIIGPATDPGIRGAQQVTFDYYGFPFKIMSSAILYKQMGVAGLGKVYMFSHNVRLEPVETLKTGRHLVEFIQVDVEEAYATYMEAMKLAEGLSHHVFKRVDERHRDDLRKLGRRLRVPSLPFKKITHREAVDLLRSRGHDVSYDQEIPWHPSDLERTISEMFDDPFFIYEYPPGARGFYDKADPARRGVLLDFDMLYPEGFGEAVSGAEREYDYERTVARMKASGENPEKYAWYIQMLRDGVPPSSGFGIGLERLLRYIVGSKYIWEVEPFPKLPGIVSP
jgi:asparaginyl-tRNA synthetase